jgi:hypothetical protein
VPAIAEYANLAFHSSRWLSHRTNTGTRQTPSDIIAPSCAEYLVAFRTQCFPYTLDHFAGFHVNHPVTRNARTMQAMAITSCPKYTNATAADSDPTQQIALPLTSKARST